MNNRRKLAIIKGASAIVVVVLVVALAAIFIGKAIQSSSISSKLLGTTAKPAVDTVESRLRDQIALQNEIDEMLLAELDSGYYSPEEPLVVVNPYNISPLTALVLFQTAEPAQVSVHIPGRIPQTEVDFTFDGFLTDHILPIYGLYAGTNNQVALTLKYQNGFTNEIVIPIKTEELDHRLDSLYISTSLPKPEAYTPGLNLSYCSTKYLNGTVAFDALGEVRLLLKLSIVNEMVAIQLMDYDHHFLQIIQKDNEYAIFIEVNPLGRIYQVTSTPAGILHHDIIQYHNQTLLALSSSFDSSFVEDIIVQIDMTTGKILNRMDLKTILQLSRNLPPTFDPDSNNDLEVVDSDNDPFHINTIAAVEGSNDIILSSRNQNQIIRLSWPDGQIRWIAGDPTGITPMFEQYYLTPVGEDFSYFYRQHSPEIMADSDGNPDTIDILLFDNGTTRNEYEDGITAEDLYSRMVQYRIDERNKTIEFIREYGQDYGLAMFSSIRGDANEMRNGNWVGSFDVDINSTLFNKAATYVEVNNKNELVWMMQILETIEDAGAKAFCEYRVERQSLYNDAANDLALENPPIVVLLD